MSIKVGDFVRHKIDAFGFTLDPEMRKWKEVVDVTGNRNRRYHVWCLYWDTKDELRSDPNDLEVIRKEDMTELERIILGID
jgi:hypothetical protein